MGRPFSVRKAQTGGELHGHGMVGKGEMGKVDQKGKNVEDNIWQDVFANASLRQMLSREILQDSPCLWKCRSVRIVLRGKIGRKI